jgi:hypothetical protein
LLLAQSGTEKELIFGYLSAAGVSASLPGRPSSKAGDGRYLLTGRAIYGRSADGAPGDAAAGQATKDGPAA